MRRALALLALAAAVLAALSAAAPDGPRHAAVPPAAAGPAPRADRAGKPLPPLEVTLQAGAATGSAVPVAFTIRPLIEMQAVRWEWELSPGLAVAGGATSGEASGARDAVSRGDGVLLVPSGGYGRVTLRVSGTFAGRDADGQVAPETVRAEAMLAWGTATAAPTPPAVTEVPSRDAESGELRPVAAVPVAWEPP